MIKKYFFCVLLSLKVLVSSSQTGPGGVGTSANNVFWLKADAGTSSTVNNAPISSWNDQSGNSINMNQTVTLQQPLFSTNVINGFPAILFDNVSTANQNDKMIGPDSPILDNTAGYSFFHVTRPTTLGDARVITSKRTTVSVDQSFMLFYYTGNKMTVDVQTTNDRFASATTYAINNNYLGSVIYNGTAPTASRCILYHEETLDRYASETSAIVPDNASPILIGTTDATDPRPFGGYMAEIIIYREALTAEKRIIVNNYLSAKYNIALSANDKYAGDNPGMGNYDREVAGIGQEAGISNPSFSASVTGGLTMVANSGLDNGDYILAGHALATNTTITTDITGMTGSNRARWERIWYIDVTNTGTNIDVNVEFDMSDGGMGPFTLGAISNYVLLYRTGLSGSWLEVATPSSISGDRITFNSLGALGDGYITLGTRDFHNSPLPIDLLNFDATAKGKKVELNWTTATEKNNAYFTIEKSKDGVEYETVTTVKGAGNSSSIIKYKETDNKPYEGLSYYRLLQTDFDGRISLSPVVLIDRSSVDKELILFPNPNNGNFSLKFPDAGVAEIQVSLIDASGREVFKNLKLVKELNGVFSIQKQAELIEGTYVLTATSGNKSYRQKLIIK